MKKLVAEHQKKWAMCIAKAWADEDYKQRLLSDAPSVLREEGLDVPEGMEIKVLENTKSLFHMVLPAAPESEDGAIENVEERLAAMSLFVPLPARSGASHRRHFYRWLDRQIRRVNIHQDPSPSAYALT